MDDETLASLIKAGEKEAFEALFKKYSKRVYYFSISYLKNENDAEEIVQELFIRLWNNRSTLDQSKNIKAYIFKITVNIIYDYIRHKNIEDAFKEYAKVNFDISSNNTWHQVVFDEMNTKMDKLVSMMPQQRRKIFLMSREDGLSNEEIARKIGISKRTVENHLYSAISFLKEHFTQNSLCTILFLYLFCS